MTQRQDVSFAAPARTRQLELAPQMPAEASSRESLYTSETFQFGGQQIHESIYRERVVAGRFAFHEFANQRDDVRLFRTRKSEERMHRLL